MTRVSRPLRDASAERSFFPVATVFLLSGVGANEKKDVGGSAHKSVGTEERLPEKILGRRRHRQQRNTFSWAGQPNVLDCVE